MECCLKISLLVFMRFTVSGYCLGRSKFFYFSANEKLLSGGPDEVGQLLKDPDFVRLIFSATTHFKQTNYRGQANIQVLKNSLSSSVSRFHKFHNRIVCRDTVNLPN